MATVYEKDLIPRLARQVGDTDSGNLYYNVNQLFSALNDGLEEFNENLTDQYEVVGSGELAYYNPEPDDLDKRLIVLYSAKVLLEGEIAKQARSAIIHTNTSGRTDLTERPEATERLLKHLSRKIDDLVAQRDQRQVQAEMSSDDASMELRSSDDSTRVEGMPITTITTTVN